MTFDNCDTFPLAQIFYNLAYIRPQLEIDYFATIFRCKNDMILAYILGMR